jgi:hypothetical protein
MTVHAVYVPEHLALDPAVAVEAAEVVRERFSFPAFLFGPLWLLRHRAWPELLFMVILAAATAAAVRFFPAAAAGAEELYLLSAVFIGFAAADIRGRALERRGYRLSGVVIAGKLDEALLRFGERALPTFRPPASLPSVPENRSGPARRSETEVIGLFPEAGR